MAGINLNLNDEDALGLGSVANSLGNIVTPGAQILANMPTNDKGPNYVSFNYGNTNSSTSTANNTLVYVIIGLVILFFIGGLFLLLKNSNVSGNGDNPSK